MANVEVTSGHPSREEDLRGITFTSSIQLRQAPSGCSIPRLGFGSYLSEPGPTCYNAVLHALRAGYRHIDTAQFYENEEDVGRAIAKSGVGRSSVFISTKILSASEDAARTYDSVLNSVRRLNPGVADKEAYVDLFMLHSANGRLEKRRLMWEAIVRAREEGFVRSVGVSNHSGPQIEEMREWRGGDGLVSVNQIELHPWCQQRKAVDYCRARGITIQAYCPLVRNLKANDKVLVELANRYGKTNSQILVRWSLQNGFVPLPKSDTPKRIEENADVFGWEIGAEDMQLLTALDEGAKGAICEAVPDS